MYLMYHHVGRSFFTHFLGKFRHVLLPRAVPLQEAVVFHDPSEYPDRSSVARFNDVF